VPGRGARRGKTRGRITGRVTALVVLLLALLVVGGAAAGTERSLPWSGGTSRTTPIERALSGVAARLAGNERTVRCASPGQWRALGAQHDFGAAVTWAMTPLLGAPGSATRPEGYSSLAPRICRHGASRGAPVLGECDGWGATLVAVHVLGHESIHLAGVVDEAAADCLAMQVDALVAMQLGATRVFARTLARDYWEQYYAAQEPEYRSPQCRDAGSLDLFRADGGWPTPRRYPPRIGEALESFGTRPVDH
jgi:hypothetical protein